MKHLRVLLLAIGIAIVLGIPVTGRVSFATIPPAVLTSSGILMAADGNVFCSAVFINPSTVLTAAHCVQHGIKDVTVQAVTGGKSFVRAILSENDPRDLATLQLVGPISGITSFDIGPLPSVGDEVWVVGAPIGEPFVTFHGYVAKIATGAFGNCDSRDKTGTKSQQILLLDARIFYGDSGGGVFNAQGQLIGIVQRIAAEGGTCARPVENPTVLWGFAAGPLALTDFLNGQ